MTDEAFEAAEDPRLAKANAIVEYLRQNPSEAFRDIDDLAVQFGADAALVDRLLRSRIIQKKRKRTFSIKKLLLEVASVIGRAVYGATGQPLAFLVVVSLLFVITAASSVFSATVSGRAGAIAHVDREVVLFGLLAYTAAQMLCLFVQPRFKNLVAAVVLGALSFGVVLLTNNPKGMMANTVVIGFYGLLTAVLGAGCVIGGASVQVTIARSKEAHLSRQELLGKMLDLQAQLDQLPAETPKVPNRGLQQFRKSLFPWAGLIGFTLTTVFTVANLHPLTWHAATGHADSILTVDFALLAWCLITCLLAYMAGTWKKGVVLALSLSLGAAASYTLMVAIHRIPWLAPALAFDRWGEESAVHVGFVVTVIYLVSLKRDLARLRREGAPNEASVVAELMEVRDRLAAASVKVYVMAVDVVGSTRMKDRADPLLAEFSFRSYQSWTADIAAKHGGKVDAMTGDGAIVAFGKGQQALSCTLELQNSMAEFNAGKNRLATPFQIRVSLHAGLVVGELDKVQFAEVIDIAAHVEKLSPVGGFAATMDFLQDLAEPLQGVHQGPVVDGRQVYLCEPSEMAVM